MEYWRRLTEFIVKDVENANETKRASVIMRSFSLIMCVYFLVQGICLMVCGVWGGTGIRLLCLMGYVGAFGFTYLNRTQRALFYTLFFTMVWVVLYVVLFGWDCGVQHFLFALLILFFAASHESIRRKVSIAVILCAFRLFLYGYTRVCEPFFPLSQGMVSLMQVINTVSIYVLISVIIILFCQDSLVMEKKLVTYNERLREASLHDPLTKLYNRRAMVEYLNELTRKKAWCNIAIGDIDFFKKVNDTYGHEAGDAVLVHVAGLLSDCMENQGRVCRWGGEEFLLVFRDMNGEKALLELEKIRGLIERQRIVYKEKQISVTMTFGLEEYDNNKPIDLTINNADQKLYMGKSGGRNRVIF